MSNYTKVTNFTAKDSLPTGNPSKVVRGSEIDTELSLIATAVATKLDTTTAASTYAPIASPTFTGTASAPTPTAGDDSTKIATTEFVNDVAMTAALPTQTGNSGKVVSTNGTTASFTGDLNTSVIKFADNSDSTKKIAFSASGITTGTTRTITMPDANVTLGTPGFTAPLATTTLGGAQATINFLNTFTASYNDYLIVVDNLSVATADALRLRIAVAGALDTGATNYAYRGQWTTTGGSAVTSILSAGTSTMVLTDQNHDAAGYGCVRIWIQNVNSTNPKMIFSQSFHKIDGSANYINTEIKGAHLAASVATGFGLYLSGGNNFDAATVRVYGMNT